MDLVVSAARVLLAVALVGALAVLGLAVRRQMLQRQGGTFDCSLRERRQPGAGGWRLGVARYRGDALEWYRVFSYSPRPRRRVARRDVAVVRRRAPTSMEAVALLSGTVVVECLVAGRPLELGMTDSALTGFLAWLEAAPPGQNVHVA